MSWKREGGRVIQQYPGFLQLPPRHGTVVRVLASGAVTIRWDDSQVGHTYSTADLEDMWLSDPLA